jgi:hypothetical protein
MEDQKLREALEELNAEIARVEKVDSPEDRALLADLEQHIKALLDEEEEKESHGSLRVRLEKSVLHFEEKHPDLTLAIGKALDIVSGAGI